MRSSSSFRGKLPLLQPAALVAALLLIPAPAAHASSIFNNLASLCSPYSQKQPSCGYFPVFGPKGDFAVPLSDYAAAQFTPKVSAQATDARFTVVQTAPGPGFSSSGSLTAAIYSDAGGFPGTQISQTASNLSAPYCCNSATVTGQFNQPVSLDAGKPYWFVLKPGATNTYVAWVVGGAAPVPVAQSLSASSSPQNCGWCSYGPSAVQFAIDSATTASPLTVVDPYLMTIPPTHVLTASAVVSAALAGKDNAKGIVADGTTAAVVVYKAASNKTVTFSVTNGAKLAEFNADFLTTISGTEANSLAVTPMKLGSAYYALALVMTGTPPDAEHGGSVTITAQSAGSSAKTSLSLLAIPTPVVLVHGLWGNLVSLGSTEGYLKTTPAFNSYRFLVTPICYSVYLGFDAETDTLPGHGTGCEVTSAEALDKYLSQTLYAELDADHYVGGRVDAVAHSMGGLVARHFTAVSGYISVRNRGLGVFRNVVTLDTPETGSALATYLDDTAYNRTRQVSILDGDPYFAWVATCGLSSSITVETCFYNNKLPLAYPGQKLSSGAVASLIPNGPSIASAPAAGKFNTNYGKWYAIASDYKDGDQPAALLRDELDAIVAATYSSSQTPPTLTSILGTPNSDVIVTVAGQTSTALAAQTKEFKDLEHTPGPSSGLALFGGDSNASVIDSAAVNGQVAYWLGLQSSPEPAVAEGPETAPQPVPAGSAQSRLDGQSQSRFSVKAAFLAPERLSASIPKQPVCLGQPVRIPLGLAGPSVAGIAVDQTSAAGSLRNQSNGVPVGSGRARILSDQAGTAAIEVTPLALGTVNLRISVLFADGGLAVRDYQLNVVPSAQGLTQLDLNRGFKELALVLEDREEDRQAYLFPEVRYGGLEYPIYLGTSEALNLTVDQPEDDPVVRVDPDGLIHALRPGTATITGDFAGVKDSIQVTVYEPEDAPAGYRQSEN